MINKDSPKNISIQEYHYDLPNDRIALHPLENRELSKLLIHQKNEIAEDVFLNIANHLPKNSFLVFNNSKVLNARIKFQKASGSVIEIFCLEPAERINEYALVLQQTRTSNWKCFVGGLAKWKEQYVEKKININGKEIILKATLIESYAEAHLIEFNWEDEAICFGDILTAAGDVPLPPYIKRNVASEDVNRYQTVYAKEEGSVAAPTAGLHFTNSIIHDLNEKNIATDFVTLHVGAGTFKPVKAASMKDHEMHAEWIDVEIAFIQKLIQSDKFIVAVGTTSLRTLESLYWLGVKCYQQPSIENLSLQQWDIYDKHLIEINLPVNEALQALLTWMKLQNKSRLFTQTQLLITPGYPFKIIKALITNFHQPASTLLLLVAAVLGPNWKNIYEYALKNDFRFLSYGDANLLFIAES